MNSYRLIGSHEIITNSNNEILTTENKEDFGYLTTSHTPRNTLITTRLITIDGNMKISTEKMNKSSDDEEEKVSENYKVSKIVNKNPSNGGLSFKKQFLEDEASTAFDKLNTEFWKDKDSHRHTDQLNQSKRNFLFEIK